MNRLNAFLIFALLFSASMSRAQESRKPVVPPAPQESQHLDDGHTPKLELELWDKTLAKEKESKRSWTKELFASEVTETVALAFGEGVYTTIMAEISLSLLGPGIDMIPSVFTVPLFILSPVVGGMVWAGGAFWGLRAFPEFRGGQLDLVRSSFALGAANSFFLTTYLEQSSENLNYNPAREGFYPLYVAFGSVATIGAGLVAANLRPISNPATGAVALSSGMTLAALVPILMSIDTNTDENDVITGMGIAANLGYAGGAVLAQYVPIRRLDTWFWDFGAAVGAYTAFSLAVTYNAPNPTIGFGATALGLLAGGSLGYGLSRWLFIDAKVQEAGLFNRVNWAPLVLNGYQTQKPVGGIQLQFAF